MKTVTFTYTKDATHTSDRVLLALAVPTDKYFGIDISELDLDDQGRFACALANLNEAYQADIATLMKEYDIQHNYRSFLPPKMSNIIIEE